MRIAAVNSFQNYTRPNNNNATKQTSFGAVLDVKTSEGFDLKNPDGVKVLKALYENNGTRKFFSEHDVILNFDRVPIQSGGWETRMHINFVDEPYRNSTYYRLGFAKEKFDVARYHRAKEGIETLTYETLDKNTSIEFDNSVKMQEKKKEENAISEYHKVLEDLANL